MPPEVPHCFQGNIRNQSPQLHTGGMEECISLSEWYDEIGLKHTDVSDYMGWNIYSDGLITVTEVPSSTDDGELCWVLEYAVLPHYKYEKTR